MRLREPAWRAERRAGADLWSSLASSSCWCGDYTVLDQPFNLGRRTTQLAQQFRAVLADAGWIQALGEALAAELDRQRGRVDGLRADAGFEQAARGVQVHVVEEVPRLCDR